jgi:glycerate kinase
MRVLIAPNAMKGSLSASEFAKAISEGLKLASSKFDTVCIPIADGGDGTAEVLVENLNGNFIKTIVSDPLGRKIESVFGWLSDKNTAVIEMADASGLKLLQNNELNPIIASSFGTGELIKKAVEKGAKRIILGVGGSATVDGGTGMMKALGARFINKEGNMIAEGGGSLNEIDKIDLAGIDPKILECNIDVACDVENPLLGPEGAAPVFAPQKGATPEAVEVLSENLAWFSKKITETTGVDMSDVPGTGAAGGITASLKAFLGAELLPGAQLILDILDFNGSLSACDLVITGEGRIDSQTLSNKGPYVVAVNARKYNIPVIALGGSVSSGASKGFDGIFSIANGPVTLEKAVEDAYNLVRKKAFELGRMLAAMNR